MVPSEFTDEEIEKARKFIIKGIKKARFKHGKVLGSPFVYYQDLAIELGYFIESESDGDRAGIIAGAASDIEYPISNLLISAVVISKAGCRPGVGFYSLTDSLGIFNLNGRRPDPDGINELTFWNNHVRELVEYYGRT